MYSEPSETEAVLIRAQKEAALDIIHDAWQDALSEGISEDILAHAALFKAIAELVTVYGEDAVAELTARLPTRIQGGEFTLARTVQ